MRLKSILDARVKGAALITPDTIECPLEICPVE